MNNLINDIISFGRRAFRAVLNEFIEDEPKKEKKGTKAQKAYRDSIKIPVGKYSTSGKLIKKYSSVSEAIEDTPNVDRPNVTACIHGRRKTAGGFVWRKINE